MARGIKEPETRNVNLQIKIPTSLYLDLKLLSSVKGITMSDFVNDQLESAMARYSTFLATLKAAMNEGDNAT